MLKGIHPAISPELLKILAEMGHGDEIVLSDAHFPAHSLHSKVIRADGITVHYSKALHHYLSLMLMSMRR